MMNSGFLLPGFPAWDPGSPTPSGTSPTTCRRSSCCPTPGTALQPEGLLFLRLSTGSSPGHGDQRRGAPARAQPLPGRGIPLRQPGCGRRGTRAAGHHQPRPCRRPPRRLPARCPHFQLRTRREDAALRPGGLRRHARARLRPARLRTRRKAHGRLRTPLPPRHPPHRAGRPLRAGLERAAGRVGNWDNHASIIDELPPMARAWTAHRRHVARPQIARAG